MSDVGPMPKGWMLAPVGELARINPREFDREPGDEEHVSFVPMTFVEAGSGRLDSSGSRLWRDVRKGYTRFQENDVLFAKITPCMENAKFALAANLISGRGAGSTEFHVIRPNAAILPKFILYYLLQEQVRREARRSMRGAAGQLRVPPEFIDRLEIPVAPIPEQARIIEEIEKQFTRLDAAVAALKRIQANLKRYRAAVLKAACEGRLVPTEAELARREGRSYEPASVLLQRILAERRSRWEAAENNGKKSKYKEPRILDGPTPSALSEGWEWASLGSIAELKGGLTKGQKRKPIEKVREVPYLRVANVQRGYLDLSEIKIIDATPEEIEELRLADGDVLFNEGGDRDKLGRGWVWEGKIHECIHQNHVFRARLVPDSIQPKFLSWYGNSMGRQYFEDHGQQTTNLASVNMTKLSMLPVPIPPVAEQRRIVAELERRLSVIDETEVQVNADMRRSERLRQGILKRAFEGKLVEQERNDQPASILLESIRRERAAAENTARTVKRVGSKPCAAIR